MKKACMCTEFQHHDADCPAGGQGAGVTTPKRPRGRQLGYRAKNPKTARLAIQVTPGTKAEVEAKAEDHGISAGEYVRLALAAFKLTLDRGDSNNG